MRKINIVVLCLILCSCASINKQFGLEDDNPIEETVEAAVMFETGLNVDLTPASPEK